MSTQRESRGEKRMSARRARTRTELTCSLFQWAPAIFIWASVRFRMSSKPMARAGTILSDPKARLEVSFATRKGERRSLLTSKDPGSRAEP